MSVMNILCLVSWVVTDYYALVRCYVAFKHCMKWEMTPECYLIVIFKLQPYSKGQKSCKLQRIRSVIVM